MIYPIIVAIISGLFAAPVIRDFKRKGKAYHGLWATALVMSCGASLAYAAAATFESAFAFRMYYLFGALLVAPYTGMGSLFLVTPQKVARILLWLVHAVSAAGAVLLLRAPVNLEALVQLAGSSGKGVLQPGPWLGLMIALNVFGTAAVVGVALYSALRALRDRSRPRLLAGNLLIGIGFLIVATAGSVARWWPDWDGGFWVAMALGWTVAFAGFRVVSQAVERRVIAQPAARAKEGA